MDCEICIHFDEHPLVRESDWRDYCLANKKFLSELDSLDIALCEYFKEIE